MSQINTCDIQENGKVPVIRIQPSKGWVPINFGELWNYRELCFFLAWRDLSVRYKQTLLGAAWAIIQPFFTMVVFTVFLGRLAKVPSDGLPYPIFSYAALLPWQYFASVLAQTAQSLVVNEKLISKVYFPRLILPLSSVIPPAVDFSIAFLVLVLMMLCYGIYPDLSVLLLPLLLIFALITALGVGIWIAVMNVQYRDFRYVVPFVIQLWLFASPVAYPTSIVPEKWHALYSLNPMVGVVEGFRWILLGKGSVAWESMSVSVIAALVILISGAYYFRRMEKTFADTI
jgi:lipopolysaccharide transport system permease protein